jgi:serine/threonine protein kinase
VEKAKPNQKPRANSVGNDRGRLCASLHPLLDPVDEIGRNVTGTLYRARHAGVKRQVAVAVLNRALALDSEFLFDGPRPGIVPARDVLESPAGDTLIVLNLPRGSNLDRLLSPRKRLPVSTAASVALGLLSALLSIHADGRAHGSVSSSSVFVMRNRDGDARVELLFLGLVGSGGQLNDPGYLSPELAAENRPPEPGDDLFAVGVILFRMIFGRLPFEGQTADETLGRVLIDSIVLPAGFQDDHPGFAAVLRRALDKNRSLRFPTATAMRDALLEAGLEAEEQGVFADPETQKNTAEGVGELTEAPSQRFSSIPTIPAPPSAALISTTAPDDLDFTKPCLTSLQLAREEKRVASRWFFQRNRLALVFTTALLGVVVLGLWLLLGKLQRPGGSAAGASSGPTKAAGSPAIEPAEAQVAETPERDSEAASKKEARPVSAASTSTSGAKISEPPDIDDKRTESGKAKRRKKKKKTEAAGAAGPPDDLSSNPFNLKNNPFPLGE